MKSTAMISRSIIVALFIVFIIVLTFSSLAFADDEENQISGFVWTDDDFPIEDTVYSLEGFYTYYNPKSIGYNVADNMEKICILGSEEPLRIKIVKEENNDSMLDHFLGIDVNRVYTSFDNPTMIYYEKGTTPGFEVNEENNVLQFTFEKELLKVKNDAETYEFVFNFDDGKAYSLVWVTKESDLLGYTENDHVWTVRKAEESSPEPTPIGDQTQGDIFKTGEESAFANESTHVIAEETADETSEARNITDFVILAFVIMLVIAVYKIYHFIIKNK